MTTLWIGLGGALGSIARHHLGLSLQPRSEDALPWGTLTVNLVGSMLLAALVAVAMRSELVSPTLRLALGTGLLGGFTTYSAFNAETLAFLQRGAWAMAASYVAATVVGCLLAGMLGWQGARMLAGG